MSDSDLRQALLGTWRLTSFQFDVDGTLVKPFGDNPQGYLVYTRDGHVFVQMADPRRPQLFGRAQPGGSPVPVLLETTEAGTALGFLGYCGTFEVRDGRLGEASAHAAPAAPVPHPRSTMLSATSLAAGSLSAISCSNR